MTNLFRATLLTSLLLLVADSRAQAPQPLPSIDPASRLTQPASARIENVLHVIGLDEKPGGTGDLAFDAQAVTLHVHGHTAAIPLRSILAYSLADGDKALISGAKGKLAEAAPYGIGFAVSMTRPSADVLTLFYRDSDQAMHGCVLILPKGSGERIVSALAGTGLSPVDYPKTGDLTPSKPQPGPSIQMAQASRPSVEVELPSESAEGIPSALPASVYEDLIEQLTRSGRFAHVWRAGDSQVSPNTPVLHIDIENWKKGSARGRSLGPFAGAAVIKTNVTLVDASGRTLFQGEVDGSKRMKGESLDAANSLAKNIGKALEKAPSLQPAKPEGK